MTTQNRVGPSRRQAAAIRAQAFQAIREGKWPKGPPREWPTIKQPPTPPATSPTLIMDGRLIVEVALKGTVAAGRCMTIDLSDWERVKRAFGDQWGLREVGGRCYVIGRGARAGLVLARWVVGAIEGQTVSYANGNTTDIRRANLVTEGPGELIARTFCKQHKMA